MKSTYNITVAVACLAANVLTVATAQEGTETSQPVQISLANGSPSISEKAVLFSFDDRSFPATRGVMLKMETPAKLPDNPILPRGQEGTPDAKTVSSPAVVLEDGKWRMWYPAKATSDHSKGRIAYAESKDGIHWTKPKLGLVEFAGSKENNLVDAAPGLSWTLSVLHDPDAPADRRYVMTGENISFWGASGGWSLARNSSITRIDVSPDGLHWTSIKKGPGIIQQQNETHTIYKFGGYYHVGGHQISPLQRLPMQKYPLGLYRGPRTFVVWRSPVLDRWPIDHVKAFYKPMQSSSPYRKGWDREEVHLGASVTSFGNVCLGVYGQWHHPINDGAPDYVAKSVSCDLGFIISNDGLHFREPAPGFTLIKRDQELRWDRSQRANQDKDNLLLDHGSIVTTERETFIYYSATSPGGNVGGRYSNIGLATLPRDRFGYLQEIPGTPGDGHVVSCPISVTGSVQLVINAEVPEHSTLRAELLDKDGLEILKGYEAVTVASGLDSAVRWPGRSGVPTDQAFRIRVSLSAAARLYAAYLSKLSVGEPR